MGTYKEGLVFLTCLFFFCDGQPLINQLAVLFRARPPFPTHFTSGSTTTDRNGRLHHHHFHHKHHQNQHPGHGHGENNAIRHDFSHFNDLLTGQSINQLVDHNKNNGNNLQYYAADTGPILATSHPLPQLEFPNGKKAVLLAHPVLGPNPNRPPERIEHAFNAAFVHPVSVLNDKSAGGLYPHSFQQQQNQHNNAMVNAAPHSFQQQQNTAMVNAAASNPSPSFQIPQSQQIQGMSSSPSVSNNDHGQDIVNSSPNPSKPKPSAIRSSMDRQLKGLQTFAQKLIFPGKNFPGVAKLKVTNHKHQQQHDNKLVAIPIPVPNNSPLLKHQGSGGRGGRHPQIIAVRQPFPPLTSVSTTTPPPPSYAPQPASHVTRFMAIFTPSLTDLSNLAPTTVSHNNMVATDPTPPVKQVTNWFPPSSSSSSEVTTPTPTTTMSAPTTTTTPKPHSYQINDYKQTYHYHFTMPTSTSTSTPGPLRLVRHDGHSHSNSHPSMLNNNIRDIILSSAELQTSPSTVLGSFRFPDPPSPPNMVSMNTRYELGNNDTATASKSAYYSQSFNKAGPVRSNSKWRPEESPSNFRPSLQLHAFEDTTSGLREFITMNPKPPEVKNGERRRGSKTLFSKPVVDNNSLQPMMESGFRPFNHFAFVNGVSSASVSTTTESSLLTRLRVGFDDDPVLKTTPRSSIVWGNLNANKISEQQTSESTKINSHFGDGDNDKWSRQHRQLGLPLSTSFTVTGSMGVDTTGGSGPTGGGEGLQNHRLPHAHSFLSFYNREDPSNYYGPTGTTDWVGKHGSSSHSAPSSHSFYTPYTTTPTTTTTPSPSTTRAPPTLVTASSSEIYEEWLSPANKKKKPKTNKPIPFDPPECEKFHKFGFCPVTLHYPLDKVDAIALRCSTLLSHLIAPLPKTDVRYDVIVSKSSNQNQSQAEMKKASRKSWNWKTFAGKPVCDTKEIKIVPGWAKNEGGEWLVILQTEEWKQEAQITLCVHPSNQSACDPRKKNCTATEDDASKTKCVQRFTAQRLVVLDPKDENRCPVVRSVFLPSACVCLNDNLSNGGDSEGDVTSKPPRKLHHKVPSYPVPNILSGRSLLSSLFGLGEESNGNYIHSPEEVDERQTTTLITSSIEEGRDIITSGDEGDNGNKKRSISIPSTSSNLGSAFIMNDDRNSSSESLVLLSQNNRDSKSTNGTSSSTEVTTALSLDEDERIVFSNG